MALHYPVRRVFSRGSASLKRQAVRSGRQTTGGGTMKKALLVATLTAAVAAPSASAGGHAPGAAFWDGFGPNPLIQVGGPAGKLRPSPLVTIGAPSKYRPNPLIQIR